METKSGKYRRGRCEYYKILFSIKRNSKMNAQDIYFRPSQMESITGVARIFFAGKHFWKIFKQKYIKKIAKNELFKHMIFWEMFRKFLKFS